MTAWTQHDNNQLVKDKNKATQNEQGSAHSTSVAPNPLLAALCEPERKCCPRGRCSRRHTQRLRQIPGVEPTTHGDGQHTRTVHACRDLPLSLHTQTPRCSAAAVSDCDSDCCAAPFEIYLLWTLPEVRFNGRAPQLFHRCLV